MLSDKEDNSILQPKFLSTNDIDLYESIMPRKQQENFENNYPNDQIFKPYERHEKFKYEKYLKKPKEIDRSDLAFQRTLRRKFVETAKKYVGTPYNKKYLTPSDPHYDSPLFLDCCGLVRQTIQDLKDDFGFTLGPWNQAYQFDTLPNEIKFEDMKPGDLIFYSGRYHDKKRRRHAHDMVHVEIYLGGEGGLQTIAARRREGVVQIFEDYRFRSTIYFNVKHYYKSLDTWLQGICKSYCERHSWIESDVWWSEKYSFFVESENDEEKEEQIIEKDIMVKQRQVYIGKGNNYKLFKSFFNNNEKWKLMNRYDTSLNYYFKWVPFIQDIDFSTFQEGKQIVNHIPNSRIISSKHGLIDLLTENEAKSDCYDINSSSFLPKSYRLDNPIDQKQFLEDSLEGIWIYKPLNYYRNKRVKIISDLEKFKQDFIEKQKNIISNKPKEYNPMKIIKKKTMSAGNAGIIHKFNKTPMVRPMILSNNNNNNNNINNNNGRATLLQNINNLRFQINKNNVRLPAIQRTASIKKIMQITQFPLLKNGIKEKDQNNEDEQKNLEYVYKYKHISSNAIFQKYIEKPFLYEGRKCELRCFVLVASTKPFLILFHHGYLKLSLDKYKIDKEIEEKKKKFMHLVNSHIQKKHPNYWKDKEKTSLNMDCFEQYLQENRKLSLKEIEKIYSKIKKILVYVFMMAIKKFETKKGLFELFGCDFILDENLNPYLMDINSNPSLLIETNTHLEVIPLLIKKVIELELNINEPKEEVDYHKDMEEDQIGKFNNTRFEILYNELTNFIF